MRSIQLALFRHRQCHTFLLLPLLLFIYPTIHAADKETQEPTPNIETLETIDSYRDTASRQVTRFANWVDNFFATDRSYDEKQGSLIKLRLLQTYSEDYQPFYEAKIKAKLDVPKTQKRMQLLIERDGEDEDDILQTPISEDEDKREQSIALRFIQVDTNLWRITTDIGGRIHNSQFDPSARLRLRRLIKTEEWDFRISETLFWFNSEGAGETTRLDMDHPLTKKLLFRSITQATWENSNGYFETEQDLIIFQNINKHKTLAYQVGVRGIYDTEAYTTSYFYSIRYRQQLHKSWLFFDIVPTINHTKDNNFKPSRSITISFEIVFGSK